MKKILPKGLIIAMITLGLTCFSWFTSVGSNLGTPFAVAGNPFSDDREVYPYGVIVALVPDGPPGVSFMIIFNHVISNSNPDQDPLVEVVITSPKGVKQTFGEDNFINWKKYSENGTCYYLDYSTSDFGYYEAALYVNGKYKSACEFGCMAPPVIEQGDETSVDTDTGATEPDANSDISSGSENGDNTDDGYWPDPDEDTSGGENDGNILYFQLGSTYAVVNGTERVLDVAPFTMNDRTLVPFRFVGESLGATVDYVSATEEVQ